MHHSRRLTPILLVVAFLVRGAFYSVEQPIWEPFDEWAHLAYIEYVVENRRLPSREEPISDVLRRAVEVSPISASAAKISTSSLTHDAWWELPSEERASRERELGRLRLSQTIKPDPAGVVLRQYQAQHPPLYYLLLAPVYAMFANSSIPALVIVLRLASLLIAAVGVLLCGKLAVKVGASRQAAMAVLLLVVCWPGFMLNVTRIGNDGLAMVFASGFLLCLFRIVRGGSRLRDWVLAGVVLSAGLLTKAYLVALVPLLPIAALLEIVRSRLDIRRTLRGLAAATAGIGILAGWWYVAGWLATGTISGEQTDIAASQYGLTGKLAAVMDIRWRSVLDTAATTHIWTGGWSFIAVRSWMDRVFEIAAFAAAIGLAILAARRLERAHRRGLTAGDSRLALVTSAYALFWVALAYHGVVIFQTRGISATVGWYLYAVFAAEVVLLSCGFGGLVGLHRAGGMVAGVAALACVFDFYTMHFVSIPYHTGLIAHMSSGALASFHVSSLRDIGLYRVFARMAVNKPGLLTPSVLMAIWVGYLVVTGGLLVYSFWMIRNSWLRRAVRKP